MSLNQIKREAARLSSTTLRDLFAADDERYVPFSRDEAGLLVDFTREKLDREALDALFTLARSRDVETRRDAMFAGENINVTEQRPALHVALRADETASFHVDGQDVMPEVRATRERFLSFAEDIRRGRIRTALGERFASVISIGIGGSDLGPIMATRALQPDNDGPRLHFVSNLDAAHFTDVSQHMDPRRTLVIVQSKSFTTLETIANAQLARTWLADAIGGDVGQHMAAVSCNVDAAEAFGISAERVFGFWDWVGGRLSIWAAIGLPLALAVGRDRFEDFLAGARAMDTHFRDAPLEDNLPVILAMIGIWRRNGMSCPSVATIPYAQRLKRFPAWLQQLDMESNGKTVTQAGTPVASATGPIIWGEPGTNGQHSFFQYLHQSSEVVPVDFILAAHSRGLADTAQVALLANALAQAQALAFGRTLEEAEAAMRDEGASEEQIKLQAPHRVFPGDRPSTIIAYETLDAFTLGRLMALYEHKVFVQGVIWGIDSFDQWGVELGKSLASVLEPHVAGVGEGELDPSTASLIKWLRDHRERA